MRPSFFAFKPFTVGLIARKSTMQLEYSYLMSSYVSDVHDVLLCVLGFCSAIVELSLAFLLRQRLVSAD